MATGRHHHISTKRPVREGAMSHVTGFILGALLAAVVMRFAIFLIHWLGG